MSIQFSDTTTKKGLVQLYEKELGLDYGAISGDATQLQTFTAEVNLAWDEFIKLAIEASGEWQFDDSNQTDYPTIFIDIVSGRRDYQFTVDATNNLILDIYKVMILQSATATLYQEIGTVDQQSEFAGTLTTGSTITGVPWQYDKTANAILLDPIPSYNATAGIKVYINREPSYFTTADTVKKPGVPGTLHKYFYLKPAMEYARRNGLANYAAIAAEVVKYEGDERAGIVGKITKVFSARDKDVRKIIKMKKIKYI